MTDYRIAVYTADIDGAGTDANVYLTLYGSYGSSGEVQIDSASDDFERGSVHLSTFAFRELGSLGSLRVRHDNGGNRPGWFLDRIEVTNESDGSEWSFGCNRWLSDTDDDGRIERRLKATRIKN
ncbi:PLAT/LH2 domain-containing protein [Streptomyces mirabilis]|uniref:PLAT/LH2 domain-containing protein n=1 Tax=Streptomyces mirabilis TaxID=68239 RepID=UPI0035DD7253